MAASRSASTQGRVLVLDTNAQRAEELCNRLRFLNYEPVFALKIKENTGLALRRHADIIGDDL